MASTELSNYAENQPLSATVARFPLMSERLANTVARARATEVGKYLRAGSRSARIFSVKLRLNLRVLGKHLHLTVLVY